MNRSVVEQQEFSLPFASTPKKECKALNREDILDDSRISVVGNLKVVQECDLSSARAASEDIIVSSSVVGTLSAANCTKEEGLGQLDFQSSYTERVNNESVYNASIKNSTSFDIPVSPKLKNRVRQRLYSLVNAIDGYVTPLDNNGRKSCDNENFSSCGQDIGDNNSASSLPKDIDLLKLLHVSTSFIEDYSAVANSIVDSHLRTLQIQQQQLYHEKLSFALDQKEREHSQELAVIRKQLADALKVAERMKWRNTQLERQLLEVSFAHREGLERLADQENESKELKAKIKDMGWTLHSVQRNLERELSDELCSAVTVTEKKSHSGSQNGETGASFQTSLCGHMESSQNLGTHQEFLVPLSESKVATATEDLKSGTGEIKNRSDTLEITDTVKLKKSFDKLKLLGTEKHQLQEETLTLNMEKVNLQKSLAFQTREQRKKANEAVKGSQDMTELRAEIQGEEEFEDQEKGMKYATHLQEELCQAFSENADMKQKLNDEQKTTAVIQSTVKLLKGKVMATELEMSRIRQEKEDLQRTLLHLRNKHQKELDDLCRQHEQEVFELHLNLDGVCCVLAQVHDLKDDQVSLVKAVNAHYWHHLNQERAHAKAQIEEYKKAVKILKLRIKELVTQTETNASAS